MPALVLVLAVGAGFGFKSHLGLKGQYQTFAEQFRGNSHFGRLQVVEASDRSCRYYLNDNLIQNTYDPARKQSASAFTYLLAPEVELPEGTELDKQETAVSYDFLFHGHASVKFIRV